ncbi:hypothetical protein BofuT4_uP085000.1 [Botrytis cinerea T4]|uniref:Uncharacterized protein n=1 Tax=Botryotinia fuckeliana (strain T4) TaxID=999810 RepID=G2YHF1_BOTF4|nr:hypothetical protein BofuT4_uP085000.1 [Botrytis cinerea T4]
MLTQSTRLPPCKPRILKRLPQIYIKIRIIPLTTVRGLQKVLEQSHQSRIDKKAAQIKLHSYHIAETSQIDIRYDHTLFSHFVSSFFLILDRLGLTV